MAHGIAGCIGQKVLLRDVSHVFRVGVLREEMIKGLIFARPYFLGNCEPPFIGIRKNRIDIVNDPAERIFPMSHDLADTELGCAKFLVHGKRSAEQGPPAESYDNSAPRRKIV